MLHRIMKTLFLSATLVGAVSSAAISATMNYLGSWVNTTTYATGSVIAYNQGIYYSLKSSNSAPNRNYVPSSNPTWWAQVGTVGNTILSGSVNPTSPSLGQVGDYYINTTTNTLFGPKTAVSPFWPASGTAMVGPKGDTGAIGPTGAAGPTGLTGATGAVGPTGATGPAGPKGDSGLSLLAGKSCPSGRSMIGFDVDGQILCTPVVAVHSYAFVADSGISWSDAKTRAAASSTNTLQCFLATITTQAELDIIEATTAPDGSLVSTKGNVYIGSQKTVNTVDEWSWGVGPEAGTVFWRNGAAVGNNFPGWDPDSTYRREAQSDHWGGTINNFYRPYMSANYGTAISSVGGGGNSGYIRECISIP